MVWCEVLELETQDVETWDSSKGVHSDQCLSWAGARTQAWFSSAWQPWPSVCQPSDQLTLLWHWPATLWSHMSQPAMDGYNAGTWSPGAQHVTRQQLWLVWNVGLSVCYINLRLLETWYNRIYACVWNIFTILGHKFYLNPPSECVYFHQFVKS